MSQCFLSEQQDFSYRQNFIWTWCKKNKIAKNVQMYLWYQVLKWDSVGIYLYYKYMNQVKSRVLWTWHSHIIVFIIFVLWLLLLPWFLFTAYTLCLWLMFVEPDWTKVVSATSLRGVVRTESLNPGCNKSATLQLCGSKISTARKFSFSVQAQPKLYMWQGTEVFCDPRTGTLWWWH